MILRIEQTVIFYGDIIWLYFHGSLFRMFIQTLNTKNHKNIFKMNWIDLRHHILKRLHRNEYLIMVGYVYSYFALKRNERLKDEKTAFLVIAF